VSYDSPSILISNEPDLMFNLGNFKSTITILDLDTNLLSHNLTILLLKNYKITIY
jgi:hypothetical protein